MDSFGGFLRRIRDVVGYTQQNVADVLGMDRSTYSYYETGKTEPNIRCLKTLARLYNLSLDDLIYCRYRPNESTLLAGGEPAERPLTELAQMRNLNREEAYLVMMYRTSENPQAFLQYIRAYSDPQQAEEMPE